MKTRLQLSAALLAALALGLAGCSSPSTAPQLIAPVTTDLAGLLGEEFQLQVGQTLNINTGEVPGEEYSGLVQDPSIAEFIPGGSEDGAEFNPAFLGVSEGQTTLELTGPDLEGGSISFELVVIPAD